MIIIENTEVFGWKAAIRGMRNPMNSWDKSDSFKCDGVGCRFEDCPAYIVDDDDAYCSQEGTYIIGENDLALMKKLVSAGSDHSKFMRMINVTMDITAPMYWWKEFDTYKVSSVRNSCSTMHKIAEKEFALDDFSHEHLKAWQSEGGGDIHSGMVDALKKTIEQLNHCRKEYLRTKEKNWWWQMIQLLPSSYNQRATVQLNYQVLRSIYHARKNHKLDEWREFCKSIETLPYSELITSKGENNEK
jgi:hypothetical protein